MDEPDFRKIVHLVTDRGETTFAKTKSRHPRKFEKLQNSSPTTTRNVPSTWISNLSHLELSAAESQVLGLGLNFARAPARVPKKDNIASIEPFLKKQTDELIANQTRAAVCNILRKAKLPASNLTLKERHALSSLRANKDIVIAKADKGNVTVVMDKDDYETKPSQLLRAALFQKLDPQRDPMTTIEQKLNNRLKDLLGKQVIDKHLYDQLRI